jgi:hypothetical protein
MPGWLHCNHSTGQPLNASAYSTTNYICKLGNIHIAQESSTRVSTTCGSRSTLPLFRASGFRSWIEDSDHRGHNLLPLVGPMSMRKHRPVFLRGNIWSPFKRLDTCKRVAPPYSRGHLEVRGDILHRGLEPTELQHPLTMKRILLSQRACRVQATAPPSR